MSTEAIVLRAFVESRAAAEAMVARRFRRDLFPTREAGRSRRSWLGLGREGEARRQVLGRPPGGRGRVPACLRKYSGGLKKAPRCPPFHTGMRLLLLKLHGAMEQVEGACGGAGAAGRGMP